MLPTANDCMPIAPEYHIRAQKCLLGGADCSSFQGHIGQWVLRAHQMNAIKADAVNRLIILNVALLIRCKRWIHHDV